MPQLIASSVSLAGPRSCGWRSCPYFVGLGGSSIWDANEAFYVETPREMIERGDYVNPTFNYEPRLNKPVLSYWIVAGFYQLFGVSVGVQRLPIALGALVLIADGVLPRARGGPLPVAADSRRMAGRRSGWPSSPRLLMFSRRIFIDIYISMFMALTLLFFALAERYPGAAAAVPDADVRRGRPRRADQGPVAALLPGLVFAALPARPSRAAARPRR